LGVLLKALKRDTGSHEKGGWRRGEPGGNRRPLSWPEERGTELGMTVTGFLYFKSWREVFLKGSKSNGLGVRCPGKPGEERATVGGGGASTVTLFKEGEARGGGARRK